MTDNAKPTGCFALLIDGDYSCDLHLFASEAERDVFMWDYAFENSGTDSETLEDFKAEHDGDLGEAMSATNDGWNTDDMVLVPPAPTPLQEAAPDMLSALKLAEKHIGSLCADVSETDLPDWFHDLAVIRAAITSAGGGAMTTGGEHTKSTFFDMLTALKAIAALAPDQAPTMPDDLSEHEDGTDYDLLGDYYEAMGKWQAAGIARAAIAKAEGRANG